MATKKSAGKKASTKKSAGKKSAKKSTKATIAPPTQGLPNFQCLLTCYQRYLNCLKKKKVPASVCRDRLQRCILRCLTGGVDPGPDEE